ncbi:hypothetical protein V7122_16995 [Bacillus sp. JJ1532]|uniref:hypothetical protein n=1 Tax=Bacillus sp. JJ1532 TaxID=3122958 RepID=UPI002FFD787B
MANCWSKKEEEILKENFSSAKWDELLKMLPNKGEGGITGHAAKLGLKRESEKLKPYYDEEKEAWIQTTVNYDEIKSTVTSIFPAKKGTTYEQANDRVVANMARGFYNIIKPKYSEFIQSIGLIYDTEKMRSIFNNRELDLFYAVKKSKDEKKEIHNKYKEEMIKEVERVISLMKSKD